MSWFYENIWKDPVVSGLTVLGILSLIGFLKKKITKASAIAKGITIFSLSIIAIVILLKHCQGEYNVTYNQNGGDGATDTIYSKDKPFDLPLKSMTKKHYVFAGWYNNENCEGVSVKNIPKDSKGNKVFWAKWDPETYRIKFYSKGGNEMADITYTFEQEIVLPVPTKKGLKFIGWCDNEKCNSIPIFSIDKNSFGNKIYWAKWYLTSSDTYTVEEVGTGFDYYKGKATEQAVIDATQKLNTRGFSQEDIKFRTIDTLVDSLANGIKVSVTIRINVKSK